MAARKDGQHTRQQEISMKRKPKFDLQYLVHWIIGIAVAAGALGLLLQVVRLGAIMEAVGVTRPAGV
jgi:hypothetical protein